MDVTGNAGSQAVNDRITVTGKDDANRNVMDYAEATVNIVNVNPRRSTSKKTVSSGDAFDESASLPEPGGNSHLQDRGEEHVRGVVPIKLTITDLTDDVYGDITKGAPDNPKIVSTTV